MISLDSLTDKHVRLKKRAAEVDYYFNIVLRESTYDHYYQGGYWCAFHNRNFLGPGRRHLEWRDTHLELTKCQEMWDLGWADGDGDRQAILDGNYEYMS
jgi:hypothetical protein